MEALIVVDYQIDIKCDKLGVYRFSYTHTVEEGGEYIRAMMTQIPEIIRVILEPRI